MLTRLSHWFRRSSNTVNPVWFFRAHRRRLRLLHLEDRVTPTISLTTQGAGYLQDFNTLADSGASSAMPIGWSWSETGSNANSTYAADNGGAIAGDTHSYGSISDPDRALGGLRSGMLIPAFGASFTNNTGSVMNSTALTYTGEQWRLGATGRNDRLDFQYSLNATSLTTGTWVDVNGLDFTAPITGPTIGALNGNLAANRRVIVGNISGLGIANGGMLWIRWTDFDATGADDGLAIDDFTLTPSAKVGGEFRSNTYTLSSQRYPWVALDADGDALVVWASNMQDGSFEGVHGQRFSAAGAKVGGEFPINSYTTSTQSYPRVALDADGDALVVWQSSGQDGGGYGIFGQRFNAAGAKVGGEFPINTYTTSTQSQSSVALDADGDALVVWHSNDQDGSNLGIYGQRINATGAKVGDEFPINTYTTASQSNPSVAFDADGDALVVWESIGQDGSGYGVFGQRFNAAGAKVGGEFPINSYTTGDQRRPSMACDADGDALVVWSSVGQDGSNYGIYGQRFNAAGAKVGGEFPINTFTTNSQRFPRVALDADGDALVVWESSGQDGSNYGVYGQRFDAAGAKVGGEFQINTYTTNTQTFPAVALDANGDALVVWDSIGQDGSNDGIYGQRFGSPNPAAKFSSAQVNDGSAQRSMVTSLKITFDSPVTFAGSPAAAFSLVHQSTSNAVSLSAVVNGSCTVVTLTFTGGSVDLGGSLVDGRYTLTVLASQFTGSGFDGNGDGTPGDEFVLVGTPANGLYRLFGDADGDGDVDTTDFGAFRTVLGGSGLTFDFDNDGDVDTSDFGAFRTRFGSTV